MFKAIARCAFVVGVSALFGCASTQPEVDGQPWNQEDEKAFSAEFEMFTAGDLNGTDDPVRHPLFTPRHFSNGGLNVHEYRASSGRRLAEPEPSAGE